MKEEWTCLLDRNTEAVKGMLKNITSEDLKKPLGQSNTIGWIMGHLIWSRGEILRVLGQDVSVEKWEKDFARGVPKQITGIDLDRVLPLFESRGNNLLACIPGLTDENLNEKSGITLPGGLDDIKGFISFLIWHETFHLGQIDLLRAGLGIGGIP